MQRYPRADRRIVGLLHLAVASALLVGCASPGERAVSGTHPVVAETPEEAALGYTNIGPAEVAALIAAGDYLVINVHIPFEGEIRGTDAHVPFNDMEALLARLPAERNAPILLYCKSGGMSRIALAQLVSRGYTNLLHLDGGMNAWQAAGYPLEGVAPPQ
jgi:phage shock protein E